MAEWPDNKLDEVKKWKQKNENNWAFAMTLHYFSPLIQR
jgi:hypothetical protein